MLALLLVCAIDGMPSEAQGDETGSAVEWTRGPGAESCISDVELLQALGNVGAEARADQRSGRIEGRIDAVAGGFTVVVRAIDPTGTVLDERRVSARLADCHTLDDALVVIVALMLDGVLAPPPPVDEDRASGPRLDVTLGVGIVSGPLPGPALEGMLGLTWTQRRLIVDATFFSGLGQSVPAVEGSLDGYRLGARLTGCGQAWRSAHASLGLCGSAELGRLVMRTHDLLATNATSRMAHARLGLATRFRYHASPRWTLWMELGGHVALGRPTVSVLGVGQPVRVFRASAIAGTLLGGVAWRLP